MNKCAVFGADRDQISIRSTQFQKGIEVVQARFKKHAFTPHRHDDYVIGTTDHGEQKFRYRGVERCSKAGQVFVIHPDELHDGRSGTEQGYSYRALYLRPSLISEVLGCRSLPFVPSVVTQCTRIRFIVESMLTLEATCDDLKPTEQLTELADTLAELSGHPNSVKDRNNPSMLKSIMERFESDPANCILMSELEAEHGVSRYSITRQFKRYTGTTPHRFLAIRRLELAKRKLLEGLSIADAANESGFADQSHFTRNFRQAYGISPNSWTKISCAA